MYRRGLLGSHVILNLPHFQPIRSSDFAQGPHTSSGLGGRRNRATSTSISQGYCKFDHVILPTCAFQMSKLFTSLFGNQSEERNQNQNRGKTFEFSQPVLIKLSRLFTPLSSNQSKARNQNQNRDLGSKATRPVWSVFPGPRSN